MEFPPLWFLRDELKIHSKLIRALVKDGRLGIRNDGDVSQAEDNLLYSIGGGREALWPDDYPTPIMALPEGPFAPDYWSIGLYEFASSRLRDVLAQPEEVIQYVPFELVRASPEARAQDYRWMRVRPHQEALDLDRCIGATWSTNLITGKPVASVLYVDKYEYREDLVPRTDIFRLAESPSQTLVTDALAARLLQTKCTGMEFADPANLRSGMRVDRLRTVNGITERRIGFPK